MQALWPVVVVLGASPPAPAAEALPGPDKVQETVKRSVGYLEKEGLAWKAERKCASCHHVPYMIWALNEARFKGYPVNEKALTEVTAWTFAPGDPAKVFLQRKPDPKAPTKKVVPLAALTMFLAVESNRALDGPTRAGLRRLVPLLLAEQADEGTWSLPDGGRPPLVADKEVLTTWTYLALSAPGADDQADASREAAREKAVKWLKATPAGVTHQTWVLRLLLQQRLGKPRQEMEPTVKRLRALQNADGGWSQAKEMASDAFATGQTLYALSLAGVPGDDPAIRRGQAFLVKSQKPDGSWAMTSRPSKPGDKGSKNLDPITFAGTGWGTVGLVASAPLRPKDKAADLRR
jgi:hypothetical protein